MTSRAYRALLRLLPRSFREEFGAEMADTFVASRTSLVSAAAEVIALSARLRFDQFRIDLRDAVRGLLRQQTFTITAVTTLALALGPMTAVMTLINGVLLNPLPGAKDLDRLVVAYSENVERQRFEFPWGELNFLDHRARKQGLSAFGAFIETSATIGGEVPQQVAGAWVSEDMFDVLGVSVARGRPFTAADMQPGAAPTLILGHEFAKARFPNGDAVGQSLVVDGRSTEIIGILPEGLRFPEGEDNFWQPLIIDPARSNRAQTYLRTMGRLADGATPELVQQQMNLVAADLAKQYPESNSGYSVAVKPAAAQITRGARRIITVLGLAAAAIFLLACTNIASLVVVRTAGRQSEFSVRTALGASASRLSRQLLIENFVLAGLAALASIAVVMGLRRLLVLGRLMPVEEINRASAGFAPLLFLIALTILTGMLLGWIVSRRAARTALAPSLRTHSATRDMVRLRQALVSVEVGAAVVLLLAAGLLLQSASRLIAIDPGFRAENVITFQVGLPMNRYTEPDTRVRFIEAVVDKLRAIPGVIEAASGAYGPMGSMRATRRFAIAGRPLPPAGTEPLAIDLPAGPTYASVLGLRVIDGRWIDERDRPDSPPVVVISESFARQYFPGERAVGQRLQYYGGRPGPPPPPTPEIVGVVSDVRQFGMAEPEAPQMYVPHTQRPWTFTSFFVRTAADPRSVIAGLPAAVHAVDGERPLERIRTIAELIDNSTADQRALSGLLAIAALVALLISTIGVYGVTAATTAARKRELAIRAAIGADRAGLIALVVRQGLVAAVIGIAAGAAAALAASNILESVLFEVKARDPWTLVTVALGLLAVSAIATYLPARRAVSGSPAVTLNEPA
jgi:putative ABC transport system permease protein